MAATPPSRVGIYVRQHAAYKGGTKEYGNLFHFTGPDSWSSSEFNTFSDNLVGDMAAALSTNAIIDETIGYDAGSFVPVFSKTYSTAGSVATSTNGLSPLETCALMRFGTDQRTVKNHPIYLFKYIHRVNINNASSTEALAANLKTALETFGNQLLAGISDGTNSRVLCGPRGAVAQNRLVEAYVTHRDFPS